MDTDFERRLSDVLHATAPEPSTAYRFAPSTGPSHSSDGDPFDPSVVTPLRRARWSPLLAAAAVVALGAGVTGLALLRGDGDGAPAAGHTTSTPSRRVTACTNDDLLLSLAGIRPGRDKTVVAIRVANAGRTACILGSPPVLSVRPAPGVSGTSVSEVVLPTKGVVPDLRLAGRTAIDYSAQLIMSRNCPAVQAGLQIVVEAKDGFEYSFPLAGLACPVTSGRVTGKHVPLR